MERKDAINLHASAIAQSPHYYDQNGLKIKEIVRDAIRLTDEIEASQNPEAAEAAAATSTT